MARPRKNSKRFGENPFLAKAAELTTTRKKPIYINTKEQKMIVDKPSGVIDGSVGLFYRKAVETNEFVKLYAEGVADIMSLSAAGAKVFALIYKSLYGKDGQDKSQIILSYATLSAADKKGLSASTFSRGINDNIKHHIIAQSLVDGVYYINPSYIYNGNRLSLVREYINKDRADMKEELARGSAQLTPAEKAELARILGDKQPPKEESVTPGAAEADNIQPTLNIAQQPPKQSTPNGKEVQRYTAADEPDMFEDADKREKEEQK